VDKVASFKTSYELQKLELLNEYSKYAYYQHIGRLILYS